jgi:carbon-monoxide dehydrogenase medium subunit
MIPSNFDYIRPDTLEAAQVAIANAGASRSVKLIAGGQSLLTALKQRQLEPGLLVDLAGVRELQTGVTVGPEGLTVGAMTRQADFVADALTATHAPVFRAVAAAAADPMVRRRGTVVGAFCEADSFGDWVPAALVHDTTLTIRSGTATRQVPLSELASKPAEGRLATGEIVVSATIPALPEGTRHAYRKVKHAAIGWGIASLAAALSTGADGGIAQIRLAAAGALRVPQRLTALEAALIGTDPTDAAGLDLTITTALAEIEAIGDSYASPEYRRRRLAILIRRTLGELAGKTVQDT